MLLLLLFHNAVGIAFRSRYILVQAKDGCTLCVCAFVSVFGLLKCLPPSIYITYTYTEIAKVYDDMYLRDQFKECLCIDNTHHKFTCQNTTATTLSLCFKSIV